MGLNRISVVFTCCGVSALVAGCAGDPRQRLLDPEHSVWSEPAPDSFDIAMETTKGIFVMRTWREWAPIGADRLYQLVLHGFYDDSRFSRIRAGFIAQFGIPGNPAVGAVWRSRGIPDDPVTASNTRGTFAYAMTGPDTRTTQIYINYADNSRLDADGFAPLGRVVRGMEVVESLYAGYDESSGGGMRGGQQGPLFEGGNDYVDREYPDLDHLIRARVIQD